MEDIYRSGAGKARGDTGRHAHVGPVDKDADVPSELTGLVPQLEAKTWVLALELVQQPPQRGRFDLQRAPRPELAEPTVEVDLVGGHGHIEAVTGS